MSAARRLPPLPSTRDVLRMYGIRAKKRLSQNFILDPRTLDKFARAANVVGKTVIEVGPGPGGITRAVLGQGARAVHVIEKDPRFLPSLKLLQEASGNRLVINLGDCLNYNMSKVFGDEFRRPWHDPDPPDLTLLGNLPFNVATPFVIRLLRDMNLRENLYSYGRVPLTLTFQYEVGDRLIAPPDSPHRSRLSVFAQNWAQVDLLYGLPGGAFVPPPAVDVAVVQLTPLRTPHIELPFAFVEKTVTALFMHKNKHLLNSAEKLFPRNMGRRMMAAELMRVARVDGTRSARSLAMDEVEALCYTYHQMALEYPDRLQHYVNEAVAPLLLRNVEREHARLEEAEALKRLPAHVTGEVARGDDDVL